MSQEVTIVDEQTAKDGKFLAILSHFWIVGTLIAWVLNLKKKNEFAGFYIRQMIGFQILGFVIEAVVAGISGTIASILGFVLFIFWILSLFGAFSDKLKPMPVIGEYFQKIFRSL